MDKFTFYRNATFGLLGMNLVLLALHLLPLIGGPPEGPGSNMARAVNRLELDKNQHEYFMASAEAHRKNMERINQQQRDILRQYFKGLTATPPAVRPTLPPEYATLNVEKVTTTYQHFLTVKDLLRPEQMPLYAPWVETATRRLLIGNKPQRKPGMD